jgi:hypothetical protein
MGEIIKVDFKKKKEAEEKIPKDSVENLQKFIDSMGEDNPLALAFKLMLSGVDIHNRIDEIHKNTEGLSLSAYEQQKKLAQSYSNEQLLKFAVKSTPNEWHKDPAFFRAVLFEFKERFGMLLKNEDK